MSDEIRGERFSYSDEDRVKVKLLPCADCKYYKGGKCAIFGEVPRYVWNFEVDCRAFEHYKEGEK
jgi:hypothetical protein